MKWHPCCSFCHMTHSGSNLLLECPMFQLLGSSYVSGGPALIPFESVLELSLKLLAYLTVAENRKL